MTLLMGFWGITNEKHVRARLTRFCQDLAGVVRHQVSGPGWTVLALAGDNPVEHAVPLMRAGHVGGWLAGSLFTEVSGGKVKAEPGPLDARDLDDGRGPGFTGRAWGRFALAAIADGGRALVLGRDPLGLSRCYVAQVGRGHVFASRLAVLVDLLGRRPAFDWGFLASWINHGALPTAGTPFAGVRQVRPGALLRLDGSGQSERLFWNPFAVAADPREVPSGAEVQETVQACVAAWTLGARRVVVDLSGGLDSSAVAWGTRHHPEVIAGYLDYSTMTCADEYHYARMVAERCGLGLERIDGAEVLPLAPATAPPERWDTPSPHVLQRRLNERQTELGGANAVHLSGGGGDQVFCARLERPYQLHDQLHPLDARQFARQTMTYGRREGFPLTMLAWHVVTWEVMRLVAPRALTRRVVLAMQAPGWLLEPYRCGDDSPPAVAAMLTAGVGRLTAGKARHAAEIAFACGMVDRDHRNPQRTPLAYPLLSAPLVELALRTPIPSLINAERDRIIFRDAMACVLPEQVVTRHDKGDYTGMYQLGIRRNFAVAKELIIDGHAASAGVIDPAAAVEHLRISALGHSHEMWPLQQLLAVESWCRAWS